jgi:hypothetical protein
MIPTVRRPSFCTGVSPRFGHTCDVQPDFRGEREREDGGAGGAGGVGGVRGAGGVGAAGGVGTAAGHAGTAGAALDRDRDRQGGGEPERERTLSASALERGGRVQLEPIGGSEASTAGGKYCCCCCCTCAVARIAAPTHPWAVATAAPNTSPA